MNREGSRSRSDAYWMGQALALAALGEGATSPNPRVGCLLVRNGEVVGRGFHEAFGAEHAEAVAVKEAGERARGATAYLNLEPCDHHGQTPPCARLLIDHGIIRVVAAVRDSNPLVRGKGFARLEAAGIGVEVGLRSTEARQLNDGFFHWHETGRPLVTLKAALSLDGMLSAAGGESRWITGTAARRFAHRLRLRHDAILVGAGTVRRDDPRLTLRLPGVLAVRRTVILSPSLDLDPEAAVFRQHGRSKPVRVYAGPDAPRSAESRLEGLAEVIRVGLDGAGLEIAAILEDLGKLGVQSVLVEGGGQTHAAFLSAGLADRAAVFVSDKMLGARGATPWLDLAAVAEPSLAWRLQEAQRLPLGQDLLLLGALTSAEARTRA